METQTIDTISNELWMPGLSDSELYTHIAQLKSRYDEPWREYHNFDHPINLFGILIQNKEVVKDSRALGWTILYHDAVYDPKADSGRNEELSAQLSEKETSLFLPRQQTQKIAKIIRATAGHSIEGLDEDGEFFLDADLAILGESSDKYDAYAKQIRKEYAHVEQNLYITGRIGILGKLATRFENRDVYRTELFRATHEAQAKQNIAREIDALESLRLR